MLITCCECGCPFDDSKHVCPDCGCPAASLQAVGQVKVSNCQNCGAPVGAGTCCEYCGSAYPRIIQQAPQQVIIKQKQDDSTAALAGFLGGIVGSRLF